MNDQYSFCESVTATGISPWCIRLLTKAGRKLSGGIDTPSFCGRVQPPHGWDLEMPVNLTCPVACSRCIEEITKQNAAEAEGREISEKETSKT